MSHTAQTFNQGAAALEATRFEELLGRAEKERDPMLIRDYILSYQHKDEECEQFHKRLDAFIASDDEHHQKILTQVLASEVAFWALRETNYGNRKLIDLFENRDVQGKGDILATAYSIHSLLRMDYPAHKIKEAIDTQTSDKKGDILIATQNLSDLYIKVYHLEGLKALCNEVKHEGQRCRISRYDEIRILESIGISPCGWIDSAPEKIDDDLPRFCSDW